LLVPILGQSRVLNMTSNPYESPSTSPGSSVPINVATPRQFDWLVWVCTLLPAFSVYVTWLVAWIALGHQPRPMLDDPKFIGPLVSAVYLISGLLLLAMLPIATAGPLFQLTTGGRKLSVRAVFAGVSLSMSVASIMILRWDPIRVVYWYFD